MTPPTPRPATRRSDGLTPLALAAGLALGHIVAAMAETGPAGPATTFTALVFVIAGSAATTCALAATAAQGGNGLRDRRPGWIVAIGAGLLAALAPGMW